MILFVENQARGRRFYEAVLGIRPSLDVPGMTEFEIGPGVKLGLMPNSGISKILSGAMPDPRSANGVPRCEIYLRVDDLEGFADRALASGARLISAAANRDWGDRVAYFADPDGHVVAFAETNLDGSGNPATG